jgi:hypothetical protein
MAFVSGTIPAATPAWIHVASCAVAPFAKATAIDATMNPTLAPFQSHHHRGTAGSAPQVDLATEVSGILAATHVQQGDGSGLDADSVDGKKPRNDADHDTLSYIPLADGNTTLGTANNPGLDANTLRGYSPADIEAAASSSAVTTAETYSDGQLNTHKTSADHDARYPLKSGIGGADPTTSHVVHADSADAISGVGAAGLAYDHTGVPGAFFDLIGNYVVDNAGTALAAYWAQFAKRLQADPGIGTLPISATFFNFTMIGEDAWIEIPVAWNVVAILYRINTHTFGSDSPYNIIRPFSGTAGYDPTPGHPHNIVTGFQYGAGTNGPGTCAIGGSNFVVFPTASLGGLGTGNVDVILLIGNP